MKKFLALAAIVTLVACEKKADNTPAADSAAMMTPPADTSMMMQHDTTMKDTTMMPRDTTKQM
ncbi:MAG: hypothetical protein ABI679_14710 [Gemmatimonadota bacterium]